MKGNRIQGAKQAVEKAEAADARGQSNLSTHREVRKMTIPKQYPISEMAFLFPDVPDDERARLVASTANLARRARSRSGETRS